MLQLYIEFVVLFDYTMQEENIIEIAETMLEQLPELSFRKDILNRNIEREMEAARANYEGTSPVIYF